MTTKIRLAEMLENKKGEFLSGSAIAEELGMTRAAIWKCIQQLQQEGYQIESVKGKGYRLGDENDCVSESCLKQYLTNPETYTLEVYDTVTSTNTMLKEKAGDLPEWHAIVAGCQTAGRGRIGRSFFSPHDSGIYLSVLLKPKIPAAEATKITTAAAVAACQAIEKCTTEKPKIKWVNDVFIRERKICGILTEASLNIENGMMDWAIMGIGINVYEPKEGFPEELKGIAGAICLKKQRDLRCRIAASFLDSFYELCKDLVGSQFAAEYRERSFLLGKNITVMKPTEQIPAKVLDIDDECQLIVTYEDGTIEALHSGEVSVRAVKE